MFSLNYFAPARPLRELVSAYYRFDTEGLRIGGSLPAELAQLRFLIRGSGLYHFVDGRIAPSSSAQLHGPTSMPVAFEAEGPLTVIGAGLMPAGWAALIGRDASELANQILPLDLMIGPAAATALDGLMRAATDKERVQLLDMLFLDLRARARPVPLWFTRVMDAWLTSSRAPSIDDLVKATGVSARQVERLSRRIYGGSPKFMARKYRALQAAVRIGTGEESCAEATASFYDQSHFIKEFKSFIGVTPKQFAAGHSPLARMTIMGRCRLADLPKLSRYG